MDQVIKVTRKQAAMILKAAAPTYRGRKIRVVFQNKITFYDTNWGGGTKNSYAALRADGKVVNLKVPAPWLNAVEGVTRDLDEHTVIVERSWFCGQDLGITIHANPCHLPKWLEAGK